jgi:uncharacterized protein
VLGKRLPEALQKNTMLCSKDVEIQANLPEQRLDHGRGRYISTYSGGRFFIDEINLEDIPMYDIAHALSMNCRFNGHLGKFYSVAEHSVIVSYLVPEEDALWGLLHDISEAFVPDIPRPFKALISGFKEYEARIQEKMVKLYDLAPEMPESVKHIDMNIVADEAAALFESPPDWVEAYESVAEGVTFQGLSPALARCSFMARFAKLMYKRDNNDDGSV